MNTFLWFLLATYSVGLPAVLFVKRDAIRRALSEANEEFWHVSGIRKELKQIADEQAAQRRKEQGQ